MLKYMDDLDNLFELMPTLAGIVICIVKIISLTCNSEMVSMIVASNRPVLKERCFSLRGFCNIRRMTGTIY